MWCEREKGRQKTEKEKNLTAIRNKKIDTKILYLFCTETSAKYFISDLDFLYRCFRCGLAAVVCLLPIVHEKDRK